MLKIKTIMESLEASLPAPDSHSASNSISLVGMTAFMFEGDRFHLIDTTWRVHVSVACNWPKYDSRQINRCRQENTVSSLEAMEIDAIGFVGNII